MEFNNKKVEGLNANEVLISRNKNGTNEIKRLKENRFFRIAKGIILDPMIIMLLVAVTIYFISGRLGDGVFLIFAIVFQSLISVYQDVRSRNAIKKLSEFIQPKSKVIRDGVLVEILSVDIVVGDVLQMEEGSLITADGTIIYSNDFSVNEALLTGESLSVFKDPLKETIVYNGTNVTSGMAIATVTAVGNKTRMGEIGDSLDSIKEEKTELEIQIKNLVTKMAIIGLSIFVIFWILDYYKTNDVLISLLASLTLSMSILPEEIPVAFTTFMALGSWRLMKKGIIVKQMKTVETLGSATVICTDKTGTLTENSMQLVELYAFKNDTFTDLSNDLSEDELRVLETAMCACEIHPFDPMEISIIQKYKLKATLDIRKSFKLKREYALSGVPPLMTHVFENKADKLLKIASKGAPEAYLKVEGITKDQKEKIEQALLAFTSKGYRVLGVSEGVVELGNMPENQEDFNFNFLGLIAFYDPPKKNIIEVIQSFYKAGIHVKIITGDNSETTISIAKQVNLAKADIAITGEELMKLSEGKLKKAVNEINLFTRMFPEAKLKVINALKANKEIVAMAGDGVNDGPALKAAHIGIAMGQNGSEIAKEAASLILIEDDLSKMVEAVKLGRNIYTNIKKAIRYIISIHIPIILTVCTPLMLGWKYKTIFSPLHIIFLELIMGPTCSIIYENEPIESDVMSQKPRISLGSFFSNRELLTSILQGLIITLGTLSVYQYAIYQNYSESITRTMVFLVIITSNVFLTLINRSFTSSFIKMMKSKNNLVIYIILITVGLTAIVLFIPIVNSFFEFEILTFAQLLISILVGFVSVAWFEIIKLIKRLR